MQVVHEGWWVVQARQEVDVREMVKPGVHWVQVVDVHCWHYEW